MAKRAQLVCQHLENISRGALEKYQALVRTYVRGRQGVYALYRRNRLYDVGLASDLRWRLNAHLKDRHGQSWDRFSVYLTIGEVREQLASHGWHFPATALSGSLQELVQRRELRRQKMPEGKRKVWKYSNP